MNFLKDILDRVSGVHATNQKLDIVAKQSEKLIETALNHENRITRLETLAEVNVKRKSRAFA